VPASSSGEPFALPPASETGTGVQRLITALGADARSAGDRNHSPGFASQTQRSCKSRNKSKKT
jgi:hypothetical protein